MMLNTVVLFITLVMVASGNILPSRKEQFTKAEVMKTTDTKTLLDMLAKLMNTLDSNDATINQGTIS